LSRTRKNVTSDLRIERLSSCSLPTSKQRKLFSNRLQTFQRRSRVLVACLLLLRSFSTEEAYPFLVSEQRKVSPSLRLSECRRRFLFSPVRERRGVLQFVQSSIKTSTSSET
jgi:hypothetical protein